MACLHIDQPPENSAQMKNFNFESLVNIICSETGKKRFEAIMEIFISLEHIKESTHFIYESIGKKSRRAGILKTRKAWVEYEPFL